MFYSCAPVEGRPAVAHSARTSSGFAMDAVAEAFAEAVAVAAVRGADKPEPTQDRKGN